MLLNPNYENTITNTKNIKRVILYARVFSAVNKASLEGQIERMGNYASAKGYTVVKEVKEIASGLNDERPKFSKIIASNFWDILLVEHKDRLTRFGFNYFNLVLNKNNQKVEVINEAIDKTKNQELTEDLIAIITSFCGRFHGANRKEKNK